MQSNQGIAHELVETTYSEKKKNYEVVMCVHNVCEEEEEEIIYNRLPLDRFDGRVAMQEVNYWYTKWRRAPSQVMSARRHRRCRGHVGRYDS
jgi:hypothetical protein